MDFDAEPSHMNTGRTGGEDITVDPFSHYTLQRYLNLTLSGGAYQIEVDNYADSDQVQKLVTFFGIGGQGTDVFTTRADGLVALDAMLANTATSMTNYIRSVFKTEHVNGTALSSRTSCTSTGRGSPRPLSSPPPVCSSSSPWSHSAASAALSNRPCGSPASSLTCTVSTRVYTKS
jgi:hypothetical protein